MADSPAASANAAAASEMASPAATPAPKPRAKRASAAEQLARLGGMGGQLSAKDGDWNGLASGLQPDGSKRRRRMPAHLAAPQPPPPPPPPAGGAPPAAPIGAAPAAAKAAFKIKGNRLVDMAAFDAWVRTNASCKSCARNAVSAKLKEFAAWVTAHSSANGEQLLKSYYASCSQKGAGNFCGCDMKVAGEERMGLASELTMKCSRPRPHTQKITLGGLRKGMTRGRHASHGINLRMAYSAMRTGLGGEQAAALMGGLDVPVNASYRRCAFKAAEKEVSRAVRKVAQRSLARARKAAAASAVAAGDTVRFTVPPAAPKTLTRPRRHW